MAPGTIFDESIVHHFACHGSQNRIIPCQHLQFRDELPLLNLEPREIPLVGPVVDGVLQPLDQPLRGWGDGRYIEGRLNSTEVLQQFGRPPQEAPLLGEVRQRQPSRQAIRLLRHLEGDHLVVLLHPHGLELGEPILGPEQHRRFCRLELIGNVIRSQLMNAVAI